MTNKFGQPKNDYDWCRKLAYFTGEEGNDHPSDYALAIARNWERINPELIKE